MPLTGCSTGPAQEDIYACEDWASAYSHFPDPVTMKDKSVMVAMLELAAEGYADASETAKNEELAQTLREVADDWANLARSIETADSSPLEPPKSEVKDVYRLCKELNIETEIIRDADQLPDWYDPK
jgi:hypothetical protein